MRQVEPNLKTASEGITSVTGGDGRWWQLTRFRDYKRRLHLEWVEDGSRQAKSGGQKAVV